MFFLNQEINRATTSNPETKSKPRIKEHEHQTYRKKKKKKSMNITKSKSMNKSKHRKMKIDTNPTKGAHGSGRFGFGLDLQGGRKRNPPSTEVGSDRVGCWVRRIEFQLKLKWQILVEN